MVLLTSVVKFERLVTEHWKRQLTKNGRESMNARTVLQSSARCLKSCHA